MDKSTFQIMIEAPVERVWDVLWDLNSYRAWTAVFTAGSTVETDGWKKGSKVLFLDGKGMGMVSMVAENRPNAYMSFRHVGLVRDGVEDTSSEKVQEWAGAMENYTLQEVEGKTLLVVEMDVNEEWAGYFSNTWPLALQRIKSLAEQPA